MPLAPLLAEFGAAKAATSGVARATAPAAPPAAEPGATAPSAVAAVPSPPSAATPTADRDIIIANNAGISIATLSITPANSGGTAVTIAEHLGALKTAHAPLPAGSGCAFKVAGTFADGSTLAIESVDLCRDPVINITVW